MDESEFKRLLGLFPVVRSRDYQADLASLSESTSQSGQSELKQWQEEWNDEGKTIGHHDAFWDQLRSNAERKVGPADAEKFCTAFKKVYDKLVHEGLSEEEARRFTNTR